MLHAAVTPSFSGAPLQMPWSESDSDSDSGSIASHFDDNDTFDLLTPNDAYRYAKGVLDEANDKQIAAIVEIYTRPRPPVYVVKYPAVYRQLGGSAAGPLEGIYGKLFRFLEFVDSAHDFVDRLNVECMVPLLLHVLHLDPERDFPSVVGEDGKRARLGISDVVSHKALLDKLTVSTTLYFGDEDLVGVECPVLGMDYRRVTFTKPSIPSLDFKDSDAVKAYFADDDTKTAYLNKLATAYDDHRRKVFVDRLDIQVVQNFSCREVFHVTDARVDDQIEEIQQICELCVEMTRRFGPKTAFVADTNKPMGKMLLSHTNLEAAVRKVLKEKKPWIKEVLEKLKNIVSQEWELLDCDACRADGATHTGTVHDKATGNVFQDDSLVQIEFKGIKDNAWKYLATSKKIDGVPMVSDISRGAEEMGVEKIVENGYIKGTIVPEVYSVKKVQDELRKCFVMDSNFNVVGEKPLSETQWTARWLAMKRAGDWGQIEHCKINGATFVTHDKVAFMFAIVREVPSMLLIDDAEVGKALGRIIYSYVMFAKPGAIATLKSVCARSSSNKRAVAATTRPWWQTLPSWAL